jgi:hypothetical protein
MGIVWILFGYYLDIGWVLFGYCLDFVWILFGYFLDVVWIFTSIVAWQTILRVAYFRLLFSIMYLTIDMLLLPWAELGERE